MELKKRSEVPEELKWDIKRLYKTEEEYLEDIDNLENISKEIFSYKDNIKTSDDILEVIEKFEEFSIKKDYIYNYANLQLSVDMTDEVVIKRQQSLSNRMIKIIQNIVFLEAEILNLDEKIILDAIEKTNDYKVFLSRLLKRKEHLLSKETEKTLSRLSNTLYGNYDGYEETKLSEMQFDDFEVDGKIYKNSYVLYENFYQYEPNEKIRKKAFESFSKTLDSYKVTFGGYYIRHVQMEKAMADIKGYDSVFDYLLESQEVSRELYDRQIDIIMKELSPIMQRYNKLVKKEYNLSEMRYEDLKIPLAKDDIKKVTIEETKDYVLKALQVMGEDYVARANRAFTDRWIDYASNVGKSTGGFCSSPYKKGSFILLSFTGVMSEVYTTIHEIGHGIHFGYASENNKCLEEECSRYMVEAPSTFNELLLSKYLLETADEKMEKYVLSTLIEATYYHNFVTHLLEAAYQREVYKLVDNYETVTVNMLSEIKKNVLQQFFGDDVIIDDYAALTWMRQPHYYMGLYSYTYSAGLTVSTSMIHRLNENKENAKDWINFLKAGGKYAPVEHAKVAGIDISTDKPLKETIKYLDGIVTRLEELCK